MEKPEKNKAREKAIIRLLNRSMVPVAYTYNTFRKLVKNAKKTAPLVYDEIESLVKSHIVIFDKKDKNILKSPNIEKFGNIITASIVRKLPNVDESHLKELISDKKSKSFIDFLAKSFGAATEHEKDYSLLGKERLFKNVLVANRGEIALRIIRACKELGIRVHVIYTSQDKDSLSVKFADKAYSMGSSSVAYLDIKKIIGIAKNKS